MPGSERGSEAEAVSAPERSSAIGRFAAIGALALLALALLLLLFGGGNDGYRYTFMFQTGGQLVPGNEVKIGGAPAGTIEDLKLSDDGQAEVEVKVDQQLHEGTEAVIRSTGLAGVANHYISITPGPNSEPPLPDGGVLTQASTTTSVDIDQLFNTFDDRTRKGLSKVIRGQGQVYEDRGKQANRAYRFLEPALAQTNLVLDELNRDSRMFEQFLVNGSRVFTALADREDDLASGLSSARQAFSAVNAETEAFSESLTLLAPTFRQFNTTSVNLRAALDDVDVLVDTAKPATADLAPFLRDLRPVVKRSVPFFGDLADAVDKPGKANDLGELTALLPDVDQRAGRGFRRAQKAMRDFEPVISFARPYAPEMVNALTKVGQITSRYDANGHYITVRPSGQNLFEFNGGTNTLDPLAASNQYAPFGPPSFPTRCPGAASQAAADGSSPFVAPIVPNSGLTSSDCDPAALPPGP